MSDVDKLQAAEEAAAQRAEQEQLAHKDARFAELREKPQRGTAARPREAASVPLAQLHPGDNIRTDLPEVQELALSIRELGLLTPLIVRPWSAEDDTELPGDADPSLEHFRVVAGHRRYAALLALTEAGVEGFDEARCEVRRGLSKTEAYALMLTENVQRVPLEPIQAARALRLLLDLNQEMTVAQLARWLGLRPAWAQTHLKLLDLPAEVQQRVEAGDLSITIADMLRRAQSTGRLDEHEVVDLAREVATGAKTVAEAREAAGPPVRPFSTSPPSVLGTEEAGSSPPPEMGALRVTAPEYAERPRDDREWYEAQARHAEIRQASHPGAERIAQAARVDLADQTTAAGEALAGRLDGYLLARALREWADDEYLEQLGIEREDADGYAMAVAPFERLSALRHLSLTLVQSERELVGAR